MIRLLLDPPRFECESADDAAALARLMGIHPAPLVWSSTATVTTGRPKPALEIVNPPDEDETARPIRRVKGQMVPTGKLKTCKKCGGDFPVADRTDCAALLCRACRPAPAKRKPRLPKAAPAPAPAPVKAKKDAGPKSCATCGATVPEFELINGECLQCAPLGARKRSA